MLTYTCDNCETTYPARLSINSKGFMVGRTTLDKESDPCPQCQEEIEKAKQEVLAKRKKKV